MIPAASRAPNLLDRVGALVPWLGEQATRIEETRRIPDDVAERLFEAGLFLLTSSRFGVDAAR
jgi:3-hydroxy-9,10-secoandrosta-1,3,5(10)-triene-9,17-dione monooxygenase